MFIPVLEAAPLVPDLKKFKKQTNFYKKICVCNKHISYLILVLSFTESDSADVKRALSANHSKISFMESK